MNKKKIIGKIDSIYIQEKKGGYRKKVSKGVLKKNKGLLGDSYAQGGSRQISLLSKKSREIIMSLETKGLCTEMFHENLTIDGLDLEKIEIGSRILIGDSIQEVTGVGKKCFPECERVKKSYTCPLSREVTFTKVLKGGIIRENDILIKK